MLIGFLPHLGHVLIMIRLRKENMRSTIAMHICSCAALWLVIAIVMHAFMSAVSDRSVIAVVDPFALSCVQHLRL